MGAYAESRFADAESGLVCLGDGSAVMLYCSRYHERK